jgi:hypothetical protein
MGRLMDNAGHACGLTFQQENAIALLASGCTVRYTALVLGLRASTVSGWAKNDILFREKLVIRQHEMGILSDAVA